PDVMCNKEIKFKLFLEKAIDEGADFIATGHYARKVEIDGINRMLKGKDSNKDQTYFLYNLTQSQLDKVLFPVGDIEKPEVRKIAEKAGLPNAKKPDSQGICFIGEINVLKFLMSKIPVKEGDIVDIDSGKVVGKHKGIYFHTIGQRNGLNIGGTPVPYFVCKKDIEKNIVYVCLGSDNPALYRTSITFENFHLINRKSFNYDIPLQASVRYRQKPIPGHVWVEEGIMTFQFDAPVRAVASGQSLVMYSGDECIGGGIIL
ncbi:MAG: tRNA 2-thiouridine(34) synthase MnmA, partial [Candidatus Dojkabacteria bacterium]